MSALAVGNELAFCDLNETRVQQLVVILSGCKDLC